MNKLVMRNGAEPREILNAIIAEKSSGIMTYLSRGKWHVAKIGFTYLGATRLDVELVGGSRPAPMNIQLEQPVGMSVKYGYGKFVFDTKVIGLEPSMTQEGGGVIVLAVPSRIEMVERRNYFRVNVPRSLKVEAMMWHRCQKRDGRSLAPEHYWQGRLTDISAGGAQIAMNSDQKADFKKGQFIGIRFTPVPYERPLLLSAQIRTVLPTPDEKTICYGLQLVGLEASIEGRETLGRLCNIVEQYHQMNQSSFKQHDLRTTV